MFPFMTFDTILTTLENDYGMLSLLDTIQEKHIQINETLKSVFDFRAMVAAPTAQELVKFLRYFKFFVRNDPTIPNGVARANAIQELLNWVLTGPTCAFANIDIRNFAFQLALRVRHPEIIDQAQKSLCGQVVLCYRYAVENPSGFITFGTSLISQGHGMLRQCLVTASRYVLAGMPPPGMPCVDYVLLCSIRCSFGRNGVLEDMLEGTHYSLLAAFFRRMGYHEVEEHILGGTSVSSFEYTDYISQKRSMDLLSSGVKIVPGSKIKALEDTGLRQKQLTCITLMRTRLQTGCVVALIIDDSLEKVILGTKPAQILTHQSVELHWVILTAITIAPQQITVTFVSHARTFTGTLDSGVFCTRFHGFICAKP